MLEPQRTNLVYQSEYLGAWSATNCSVTANSITSPEGVTNSFKITENSAASTQHRVALGSIGGSSATYTMSAYVKNSSGTRMAYIDMGPVTAHFNFSTQTIYSAQGTADWEDAGDGWYRIWMTSNTAITSSTAYVGLSVSNNETYSGDGSSAIEFYGIQIEAGSYPTSYIPTYGTSVSRSQENCYKTGISDLIGQTQGTIFFDWIMNHESPNTSEDLYTLSLSDGSGSKLIGINNYNNALAVFIKDTTTQFFDNSYTGGADGARIKLALAYANNDIALYINGTQIATDSSASIPTLNQIRLNTFWTGNLPDNPSVNQLSLFKTRLTNAELAALTA